MALLEEENMDFCHQALDKRLNSDSGVQLIKKLLS